MQAQQQNFTNSNQQDTQNDTDPWNWGWEDNRKPVQAQAQTQPQPQENSNSIQEQIRDQADAIISSFGQGNEASWNWSTNNGSQTQNSPRNNTLQQNTSRRSSGSTDNSMTKIDNINQGVRNLSLQNHDRGNIEVVVPPPVQASANMSFRRAGQMSHRSANRINVTSTQSQNIMPIQSFMQPTSSNYSLPDLNQPVNLIPQQNQELEAVNQSTMSQQHNFTSQEVVAEANQNLYEQQHNLGGHDYDNIEISVGQDVVNDDVNVKQEIPNAVFQPIAPQPTSAVHTEVSP